MILCDVGLYQRISELKFSSVLTMDDKAMINAGAAAELVAGTELLACSPPRTRAELFYWHRESRNSNAEVDYVTNIGGTIVPIEVKAGVRGAMQSLRMFMKSHPKTPYAIRTSLEPFSKYGNVTVVPLYGLGHTCNPD